jgi:hypothetical protein
MRRHKQCGVALVLVLILVASASVLGLTYVYRTTVNVRSSENLLQATRARYLAESGLHHALCLLQADPNTLSGSDVTPLGPFHVDGTDDSYFLGAAAVAGKPGQYLATGRGQVGAIRQTVAAKISVGIEYATMVDEILQPQGYWRLGETFGATAYDEKSLCNGTYTNGVSLGAEGALAGNAAARFDGINDRVDLGKYATPDGEAMTIAAWVLPQSYSHLPDKDGAIFSKAWGADDLWDIVFLVGTKKDGSQTRLRFVLQTNGGVVDLVATQGDVAVGKWAFVAATYDGAMMRLYQDGVLVGSCSQTGKTFKYANDLAWIGDHASVEGHRPWWGRIDEVCISGYWLDDAQIQALYEARKPKAKWLSWDE